MPEEGEVWCWRKGTQSAGGRGCVLLLDEPVAIFGKVSPTVSAMKEHEEGVAVGEEGHFRETLHDESEHQVIEKGGDFHQLCNGELLLLFKQLIVIQDTVREKSIIKI